MKKIQRTLLVSIGLSVVTLLIAAAAWAYPVGVGSTVTMYANDTYAQYEGNYQARNNATGSTFGVFCLEMNEYFTPGAKYTVASIEDYANNGGVGGASDGKDYLRGATKWLYYHFMLKDIQNVTGIAENDYNMQLAIWYLENEITAVSGNAKIYVDKALEAEGNGSDTGDVKVMNLVDASGKVAQSQLIGAAPVPEPATVLLLSVGLAGAGMLNRRKNKK